jgi:lipopolysaccharide/colanic/teichoic acid biosynthesis glycosyltransferase
MRRLCDAVLAAILLVVFSPIIGLAALLVWVWDRGPVVFRGERVGLGGVPFQMVKIRTMKSAAQQSDVDSTAADDPRLTRIGIILRRHKLDELPQFWNVLTGEMSLVGPRPNVPREVALYTNVERPLLTVRPGVTDLASVVFADLAEILRPHDDANIAYNQLVRPWKSRLGLFYVKNRGLALDIQIVALTVINLLSRGAALAGVARILRRRGADEELCQVAGRTEPLRPLPPPGAGRIVTRR